MADGFLKRWSRRKLAERTAEAKAAPESPPPVPAGAAALPVKPVAPASTPLEDEEAFDPATLPPLESLGPDSDYTVFLKKGVPDALRTAALRKAWMSDPFIRDHRGPAEYALDYTTSEFDLLATDDVAKMLDRIFPPAVKDAAEAPAAEAPPPTASGGDTPVEPPAAPALPVPPPAPETPRDLASAKDTLPIRRKHGGALPD